MNAEPALIGPAVEEVLQNVGGRYVVDQATTILKQHKEQIANIEHVAREMLRENVNRDALEEEAARLISEQEEKTRQRLTDLCDWFREAFDHWRTTEG